MSQTLFTLGSFVSHSGVNLDWKIDCDALTDDDLDCLADVIENHFGPINYIISIPNGGYRLADFLRSNRVTEGITLIVDDVLTTGASMEETRKQHPNAKGVVIFARGPCPDWVWPVFQFKEPTP